MALKARSRGIIIALALYAACFLALYATLTRDYDATIVCEDESFEFSVVLNATLEMGAVNLTGIFCSGWKEGEVADVCKAGWFLREICFVILKIIILIGIMIMNAKFPGECKLKVVYTLIFVLILIAEMVTLLFYNGFSSEKLRISMKLRITTVFLKFFEYVWFGSSVVLLCFIEKSG